MNVTRDFRIAIADDHPVIRHAVIDALQGIPGFKVELAAKSGAQLLASLTGREWDLIVTDFSMDTTQRETDGLSLIARLRQYYPRVPVVVFTMLNNDDVLTRLSRSGIAGIVDKCEGIDEFRAAATEVLHNGRRYFSARVRTRLLQRPEAADKPFGKQALTRREIEVIRYFASGASLTEIARKVNRSISTVATQKNTAMKKLHAKTNADLVKYAQENGLV
jgi:two-component system, NarL family, captular synthesis response regulator RcsB